MFDFLGTVNGWVDWLAVNHGAWVIAVGAFAWLAGHLSGIKQRGVTVFSYITLAATIVIFLLLAFVPESISFGRVAALVLSYGVALFIVLSNYMQKGFAERLTRWRGEKWIKELDYAYLTLGSAGILATVNRLSFVTGRIEAGDMLAPVLLTTAVVIRFIKTRAEIGGWNKLAPK